ncbi:MAG: metalloprotease [Planctomycetota bacterium]
MTRSGWLSLRIGPLGVRIHVLLVLVVVLLAWQRPALGARYGILLGTLVLHELSHALSSLALGGRRAVVSISPVFGWASVDRLRGRHEALVAAAGPVANLLVALVALLAGAGFDIHLGQATFPDLILTANLLMGVFNLVPIGPLDGGRIVRALKAA